MARPTQDDHEHIVEVRKRLQERPDKAVYTLALELAHEQESLPIKPESFARRIADKVKRAEGQLPSSPYRAAVALDKLRQSIHQSYVWLEVYRREIGYKPPKDPPLELSPWSGNPMELLNHLLSLLESES